MSIELLGESINELSIVSMALRILMSMVCSGVIGLERGKANQPAGMRTYMLVSLGACIVMITGDYVFYKYGTGDPARLGAQVVSGIGFLGAGTIMITGRQQIKGLTTAAGLWASACMGLAIGAGFYESVLLCAALIFLVMRFLPFIENELVERARFINIYVEFHSLDNIGAILSKIKDQGAQICDVDINRGHNEYSPNPSAVLFVQLEQKQLHTELLTAIAELDSVYTIDEF